MKMTILKHCLFLSALLYGAMPALAQASWEDLKQLPVGERIQVIDQKLKSLTGTILDVSDEAISLRVDQNWVAIQRADVFRVSSLQSSKRGRNAIIGALIGATTGLVAGAAYCHGDCDLARGIAWGAPIMLGLGAGAGIGAAFPSHPTIYRSAKRKEASSH